jgi:hypothetical protein
VKREGPFWDVMEGRAAPPPVAALLGWELVAVDPEAGTIEVAFTATALIRLLQQLLHLAELGVLRITQPLEQHHLRGHDLRAVLAGPVDRGGPVGRIA